MGQGVERRSDRLDIEGHVPDSAGGAWARRLAASLPLLLPLAGLALYLAPSPLAPDFAREPLMTWLSTGLGVLLLGAAVLAARRLQRRLRRAEGLLAALAGELRDAVFAKDLDGRYLLASSAAGDLLKTTPAAMIGRRDEDLVDAETARAFAAHTAAALDRRGAMVFRERLRGSDGREREFLISKLPLRDSRGRLYGILGLGRDVSAEVLARRVREQRDSEYRMLFEQHPLPLLVVDSDTHALLAANPAAQAAYGFGRDEIVGLPANVLAADPEADGMLERARRHRHKLGDTFDVEVHATEALYGGRPARVLVVCASGVEQMRVRELEDLARRYRDLFDAGLGLVWTQDVDGRLLSVNAAMAGALGVEPEELVGRRLVDLVPEDAQEMVATQLDRLRRQRRDAGMLHFAARNGERRVWQYRSLYYPDADPKPYALVAAQDITLRQAYETHLREQLLRDPLTQSFNRRYLDDFAAHARPDQVWGCVVVDIDRFKHFNDTYGHQRGDEMLVDLARFLRRHSRQGDAVVRLGGDEFMLLLPETSGEVLREVASRLGADALNEIGLGFSVGVALREGEEALETTVHRADQTLLARRAAERGGSSPAS